MSIYDTIRQRRTIRRFKQDSIEWSTLEKLIDAARFAPSASNMQPVKYMIVDKVEEVDAVFEQVKWAGYITPHGNPADGERPVAYIAVLVDAGIRSSGYELDIGAAVQNILLAAWEEGIGTCWMGAIHRENILEILGVPDKFILNTVIALGYSAEEPVTEDTDESIKYYKDNQGVLHVPKRRLEDIIVGNSSDI